MSKVSMDIAKNDVEKWLTFKKVNDKKREAFKVNIDAIAESISEGILILNEDFSFTHKLLFPIGEEAKVSELKYKARLSVNELQNALSGKSGMDARILATAAALSNQPKKVVESMDTEDYNVAGSIAVFFV